MYIQSSISTGHIHRLRRPAVSDLDICGFGYLHIVVRSSHQPMKWVLLICPVLQRSGLRLREVPKDTKASSEKETEGLRAGFCKEGAT